MRACSDRMKENGFKLEESRSRVEDILYYDGGETLEQVTQRGCGCPPF